MSPYRHRARPPAPVRLDDELLTLHEDEPELLAIADAVAATQRSSDWRHRRRLPAAAAVAAAIAVAAGVAVALTEDSSAGVVDDARRALEQGSVLHAIVSTPLPNDVIVDVARGTTAPSRAETLAWFDSASGRVRVAGRRNGEIVSVADTPTTQAARFLQAYDDALAAGRVEEVSEARRSFAIRADGVAGVVELGADDLPESFTPRGGRTIRFARFAVTEAVPAVSAPPATASASGSIVGKETTTLAAATRRAGFRPLAPEELAGLPLRRLLLERLATADPQGALVGNGVAALYSDGTRFIAVRQSRSPAPAYGFVGGLTAGGNPVPRNPRVDVRRQGTEALGQFRLGDVYVAIRASNETLVVSAVRELRR
ncbi:MAG TPA: hypothetical protein VF230_16555 [Acidimicrobiales bacterium]